MPDIFREGETPTNTSSTRSSNTTWRTQVTTSASDITCSSDAWVCWNGTIDYHVDPAGQFVREYNQFPPIPVEPPAQAPPVILPSINRQAAIDKSRELLCSFLSEEQLKQLDRMSAFIVECEERKYRINYGRVKNIDVLDREGRVIQKLCAHPKAEVPDYDTMLAQKFMLETDEAEFLRIANKFMA